MAQAYSCNVMPEFTRAASDAVPIKGIRSKLKKKYTHVGTAKTNGVKTGGNSGLVGRRAKAKKRGHSGGQETTEQRAVNAKRSAAFQKWRSSWGMPGAEDRPELEQQ